MPSQEEFLELFGKHETDIKAFVRTLVRSRHDYEDICQSIALTLWRKFVQYDPARPFGAWARGVAAKDVYAFWARSKRLPMPLSSEAIEAVLSAFAQRQPTPQSVKLQHLEECLKLLSEENRGLLSLKYTKTLSLSQIARSVETTVDGVHMRLSRLRKKLHECVERRMNRTEGVGS